MFFRGDRWLVWVFWVVLLGVLWALAGCQATAGGQAAVQFSGGVNASGSGRADGQGLVSAKARARAGAGGSLVVTTSTIRFVDGKLDYQGTIHFAYDLAKLEGEETFKVLEALRAFLAGHPAVKVRIEGHTDSRGSEEHNRQLSRRRAEALMGWLSEHGIDKSRLEFEGRGEQDAGRFESAVCLNKLPRDSSICEGMWAQSRRAVFSVTAGAETIQKEEPTPIVEPTPVEEVPPEKPTVRTEARTRRWWLGGHLGFARITTLPSDANRGFLGPDVGLWLSPRWSLGLTGDVALGNASFIYGRGMAWLEAHSSTGPGPELWLGGGLGVGTIPQAPIPPGLLGAVRLGVDIHPSVPSRLGFFVEAATHANGSVWAGLGMRLAYDVF